MTFFLIVGCWAISFLFAGIEAGLLALNPVRLRHRAKNGERAALRLQRMLQQPERVLVTVLLATNAADIIALILLTRELVNRWGLYGYFVTVIIALPVHLFLLGVLPQSLFRRFPFRALGRLCGLLELATALLWPLHALGEWVTKTVFNRGPRPRRLFAGREELKLITMQSEKSGEITSAERAIIHNVVDFTSVRARDVMVPIEKTVSVPVEAETRDILALSAQSGIDRFPVLDESQKAVGLINVYDLLFDHLPSLRARDYMRRIIATTESEEANRLIRRLREARVGLAAVIDHEQRLRGIVTLEDLLRQLVRG